MPNPCTQVQSLLDSIEGCTDPKICARVAEVPNEANGMLADFELSFARLLPVCLVAAKVANKRKNTQISGLVGNFKAGTVPKTVV